MYLQGAPSGTLQSAGFSAILIQQPISELTPTFPVLFFSSIPFLRWNLSHEDKEGKALINRALFAYHQKDRRQAHTRSLSAGA